MGDILTFTPRPKPPEAGYPVSDPATDLTLRAQIEEAAEFAVDTAQRLIAILDGMDGMDGDADLEECGEAEPSLAAPESHHASQVGCGRGGDQDREAEAAEITLLKIPAWPWPPLRWGGRETWLRLLVR